MLERMTPERMTRLDAIAIAIGALVRLGLWVALIYAVWTIPDRMTNIIIPHMCVHDPEAEDASIKSKPKPVPMPEVMW